MGNTSVKAAVCRQFGAPLVIETLSLAPPAAREVRVNIAACAVCHSDLIYMDGGWGGAPPLVCGHEGAGVVVEAGADANIALGTPVLVTLMRACGSCTFCQRGMPALCEDEFNPNTRLRDKDGKPVAVGLKTGAFAEQAVVDRSQIAVLPPDLPFTEACLLGCGVITGWGAVVNTARVPVGAAVAVVGCGGVGLNCVQAAAQAGAFPITAIDLSKQKLAQAKQLGATHTLNAGDQNMPATARTLTDGRGFDYVFMAASSARAVETAAALLARMGTMVLAGMSPDGDHAQINNTAIACEQQKILGSKMGGSRLNTDIPKLLRLHRAGRLKLKELVGGLYPLEKINDAIAAAKSGDAMRSVVVFD